MTGQPTDLLRSRQELDAARHLAEGGFSTQAISRAYYAAYFAAEAALLVLDETCSKHSGVISAFGKLFVRGGYIDAETGRLLRSLFDRRNEADYGPVPSPPEEAEAAISDAGAFVDAVAAWMDARP